MDLHEIVSKLAGDIFPVGETHIDGQRLENLKNIIDLTEKLISDISEVAQKKDSYEYSVKTAGIIANNFLNNIFE